MSLTFPQLTLRTGQVVDSLTGDETTLSPSVASINAALAERPKTVNGVAPDANGNVEVVVDESADATTEATGLVQLAGALGGIATAPTALGYASAAELAAALEAKQNALAAGTGITIEGDTISATGGGGGGATTLDELSDVAITSPSSGQVLKYNGSAWVNGTDSTGGGGGGGGDALVSQPLSQFAATTSAQLRGVISDETGSGALVFGTGPTIDAPTISGVATMAGASITTAAAMAALAIDVTKMLNTKSISANSTLTFSAAPAANTWFGLHLVNTSGSAVTVTIPSSYSMGRQANVTSFVLPGNGEAWLTWRYTGAAYRLFGEPPYLNKYDATAAPTVNDDLTDGFGPGSTWLDATNDAVYVCESAAAGAAVWHQTNGAGGSDAVSIQAYIETPTDKTYKLLLSAPIPFDIAEVITQTESGSCTATATIDGVALGGAANSASTTEQTRSHATANAVAVGQTVSITVSASAAVAGLSVSINGTRA